MTVTKWVCSSPLGPRMSNISTFADQLPHCCFVFAADVVVASSTEARRLWQFPSFGGAAAPAAAPTGAGGMMPGEEASTPGSPTHCV